MKKAVIVSSTLIFCMSALAVRARAQGQGAFPELNFSATEVVTAPDGKTTSMKIYRLGDKMRTDMPGGKMHTLFFMRERKAYMVMPQMCMQMPQMANLRAQPLAATGSVTRKDLGSAVVDGHPTKIVQITVTPAGGGKPMTMKTWEATDLKDFPIRIQTQTPKGPATIDYKDVNLSSPASSLFAVPQNCRTMPMMPGMPHPGQ
jgi:hypothetical protein